MSLYTTTNSAPLADGHLCAMGSLSDELAGLCKGYRRTVAGRYAGATKDTLAEVGAGPFQISPKIDGELWFLVSDGGEVFLAAPNGRVIYGNVPLLTEAAKSLGSRSTGRTILAGELWVIPETDRPRVGAVVSLLSGGASADVKRLCFSAFDLVTDGALEGEGSHEAYSDRLSAMETYLEGGKRARVVKTQQADDVPAIESAFAEWVDGGKAEGVIVRTPVGRIVKVKPEFFVDVVIMGYTQKTDAPEEVGSILLAFMRDDGSFQLVGACGSLGDSAQREALYAKLSKQQTESNYRYASSRGAMYRFVTPTVVVEIRVSDVQTESVSGAPTAKMALTFDGGWHAIGNMPSVGLIHPVFMRFREDKEVNKTDIRLAQVQERCFVTRLDETATKEERPTSEVLKREVYTKVTKGETAVKKLMLWKTNKEDDTGTFPAFVVHVTDYSPGRKDPIKRKVELAPTLAAAEALYADQLKSNIKRGWNPVE